MPPRFSTPRASAGSAKAAWWKKGASGAPSPPAARSRGRKSATVVQPVRSAITRGIADLERRVPLGVVGDGLAVRGDRVDLGERDARVARDRRGRRGEALAELDVEARELGQHLAGGDPPAARSWMRCCSSGRKRILAEGAQAERPLERRPPATRRAPRRRRPPTSPTSVRSRARAERRLVDSPVDPPHHPASSDRDGRGPGGRSRTERRFAHPGRADLRRRGRRRRALPARAAPEELLGARDSGGDRWSSSRSA